jgi:aarF domain-containing kinase
VAKGASWDRSRELLSLAAGVAGQEVMRSFRSRFASTLEKAASSDVAARVAQAELIAGSLGRMKGAFMKAGQLLSIDASDILPPEAVRVLAQLQGHAEPVDFDVVREVILEDLGEDGLASLHDLEVTAAAAASIGQVHRAVAFGVPVAVKVQYPGIPESIDSDLALVEKLAQSWLAVGRRRIDLHGTFEELRTILHLEADYERERGFLQRFGELLADDPRFVVPHALPRLSSRRVLTMTWEEGVPLGSWLETRPDRAERSALASALLDLFCRELFEWGLVQTDPNFGNFLVRGRADEIVLLDFGATLTYDESFRADYARMLRAMTAPDDRALVEVGIAHGLLDPRESPQTRATFAEMMRLAVEPFTAGRGAFAFADGDYAARSREVGMRFVQSLRFSPPPRRLLFLHRKLGGLFQLCKRLEVELDLAPVWARMIG